MLNNKLYRQNNELYTQNNAHLCLNKKASHTSHTTACMFDVQYIDKMFFFPIPFSVTSCNDNINNLAML